MKDKKKIKVVVAAINADGDSDFYFCYVMATQDQIDVGDHYQRAEVEAELEGYEPKLSYDEQDRIGEGFWDLFVWESASVLELE